MQWYSSSKKYKLTLSKRITIVANQVISFLTKITLHVHTDLYVSDQSVSQSQNHKWTNKTLCIWPQNYFEWSIFKRTDCDLMKSGQTNYECNQKRRGICLVFGNWYVTNGLFFQDRREKGRSYINQIQLQSKIHIIVNRDSLFLYFITIHYSTQTDRRILCDLLDNDEWKMNWMIHYLILKERLLTQF